MQNPKLLDDAPHRIIYSELLKPEAIKGLPSPTAVQLSHEGRVLFAAGSHTVGTTLMTGVYYLLRNPEAKQRLVDEVRTAWPVLDQAPRHEDLEKLPFLASMFVVNLEFCSEDGVDCCHQRDAAHGYNDTCRPSTCSAAIWCRNIRRQCSWRGWRFMPVFCRSYLMSPQTVVSQSALYVLFSEEIFARPHDFLPDRWLQPESKALESWLVAFSKGPRSCLGIK
jgi:Cytochrome P450